MEQKSFIEEYNKKEEVISRLLSLNFSHYEEEVKEGLHIQGDRLIKKGKKY